MATLNPAAFTPAPQLYPTQCVSDPNFCTTGFGDLARNLYHGPFQQNWDVSFLKHFKIGERQDIRFAADFFNLWNHTNFANPTVTDIEAYLANRPIPEQPVRQDRGNERQPTADSVLVALGVLVDFRL